MRHLVFFVSIKKVQNSLRVGRRPAKVRVIKISSKDRHQIYLILFLLLISAHIAPRQKTQTRLFFLLLLLFMYNRSLINLWSLKDLFSLLQKKKSLNKKKPLLSPRFYGVSGRNLLGNCFSSAQLHTFVVYKEKRANEEERTG